MRHQSKSCKVNYTKGLSALKPTRFNLQNREKLFNIREKASVSATSIHFQVIRDKFIKKYQLLFTRFIHFRDFSVDAK